MLLQHLKCIHITRHILAQRIAQCFFLARTRGLGPINIEEEDIQFIVSYFDVSHAAAMPASTCALPSCPALRYRKPAYALPLLTIVILTGSPRDLPVIFILLLKLSPLLVVSPTTFMVSP